MKYALRLFLLFILLTVPFVACQRDSVPTSDDLSQANSSISIEEAKSAYKLIDKSTPVAGARKDGKPGKIKYLNWNKAVKRKKGNEEIIDVPLFLNSPWSLAKKGFRRVVFFKNKGKIESRIVQVIGDKDYLAKSLGKIDSEFSGTTSFFDLDYNFLGGFSIKKGIVEGVVYQVDGEVGLWYKASKNGRGDVMCWSQNDCYSRTTYSVVMNPNGNNLCGPTATCQVQTITTMSCHSQMYCAGWGQYGNYYYGDPTCLFYINCNQTFPDPPEIEQTPFDEFYATHSNRFTTEELQWIRLESEQDPGFLDLYRTWSDLDEPLLNPSNAGPLTSQDVQAWARAKNLFNGVDAVRGNRRAGKAFERAALKYLDIPANGRPFSTDVRKEENTNYPPTVIPDGIKGLLYQSQTVNVHIEGYNFVEVKSVDGALSLSSNQHQIRGFLDALRQKRDELQQQSGGSADRRVRPKLVFMTTSNTSIGTDIIQQANQWGIRLYQMKAHKVNSDYSETPNDLTISFGPFRPLNYTNEAQTDVPLLEVLKNIVNHVTGYIRSEPLIVTPDIDDFDQDDN